MAARIERNPAWQDRRVIVAGGTTGLGFVIATGLARAGARLLIVGRSSESVRQALAALPGSDQPGRILGCAADLCRAGEGGRVVGEALDRFGGVDDLFFCIGRSGRARILDTPAAAIEEALAANLISAVEITRAAAADIAAARGHMVYIGSLAGKLVTPFMGPYCVAKSALAAYVDAVRIEIAPRGAHVLLVSPGPIRRVTAGPALGPTTDRYADEVSGAGLPEDANLPGGGAGLSLLDPERLTERIFEACRQRTAELVLPRRAALLAGIIQWCPNWGRRLLGRLTTRSPG
ncbi:MAG: SDR family NAD(P)-dependent oxidoreductase [Planctomycetota bacterium]|nr:MAG: SDR family NAD(P)-dependent oxidoreductase [Planctomycetota bacterium]